jgi:hypothetical protein
MTLRPRLTAGLPFRYFNLSIIIFNFILNSKKVTGLRNLSFANIFLNFMTMRSEKGYKNSLNSSTGTTAVKRGGFSQARKHPKIYAICANWLLSSENSRECADKNLTTFKGSRIHLLKMVIILLYA